MKRTLKAALIVGLVAAAPAAFAGVNIIVDIITGPPVYQAPVAVYQAPMPVYVRVPPPAPVVVTDAS